MQKPMKIMLIIVSILFGGILLYKIILDLIFRHFIAAAPPAVTVSSIKAEFSLWQPQLKVPASLRAIQGVSVTTEAAGIVDHIDFTPGTTVEKGAVLVTLNSSSDIARLHSLEALAQLAKITVERDQKLYAKGSINQAQLDTDEADLKNKTAQADEQAAIVAKKTIRAPFAGRLGVSAVSLGQYLNPGDKIVTLQALDPLYANFYVPQKIFVQLKVHQSVDIETDAFPHQIFKGEIHTLEPLIDQDTRTGQVEAIVNNPDVKLVPGMFVSVVIKTGDAASYITLPQSAVSFNPYGSIVYMIKKNTAIQTFVITGDTRGDQIAILKGVQAGDEVVTSGQLKLKNNTPVTVDNAIKPDNHPAPDVGDE